MFLKNYSWYQQAEFLTPFQLGYKNPHAMPEIAINKNPVNEGALALGINKIISPIKAMIKPNHSAKSSFLPLNMSDKIMVTCTDPNKIKAPVPVSKLI